MKKCLIISLLCLICVFAAVVFIISKCAEAEAGMFCIRVYDGFSSEPIEGAKVTIPETGMSFYTDKNGETEKITVPIEKDSHYDKLLKQEYGCATVIVSAEGYLPYAIFYVQVVKDTLRSPNIWLFKDDGTSPSYVIIESPDSSWAETFIEKYQ